MLTRKRKRGLDATAFRHLRGHESVMCRIYSFLSVADRLNLGGVDRAFRSDVARGRVTSVYGRENTGLVPAIAALRAYLEFEGTPASLDISLCGFGTLAKCWEWVYDDGCCLPECIQGKIEDGWFGEESGYDIEKIKESGVFGAASQCLDTEVLGATESEAMVINGFKCVNDFRSERKSDLAWLVAEVERLSVFLVPVAPFNALFDLMDMCSIDTECFLPTDGHSKHRFEIQADDSGLGSPSVTYLRHLRPRRKFSFHDGEGRPCEVIFLECGLCGKTRDDVVDEFCGSRFCRGSYARCADCSKVRKCSTCKYSGCECRLLSCSLRGCKNKTCSAIFGHHRAGGFGCGFVEQQDLYIPHKQFCGVHKPTGTVRAHESMYL